MSAGQPERAFLLRHRNARGRLAHHGQHGISRHGCHTGAQRHREVRGALEEGGINANEAREIGSVSGGGVTVSAARLDHGYRLALCLAPKSCTCSHAKLIELVLAGAR